MSILFILGFEKLCYLVIILGPPLGKLNYEGNGGLPKPANIEKGLFDSREIIISVGKGDHSFFLAFMQMSCSSSGFIRLLSTSVYTHELLFEKRSTDCLA